MELEQIESCDRDELAKQGKITISDEDMITLDINNFIINL
jgi:hypothetical protein